MARFVVHWLVASLALALAARLLPGFWIREAATLVFGGAAVGLANAAVAVRLRKSEITRGPLTFALALLAVNVVAFGVLAALAPTFPVGALWQVGLGGLAVTLVSWATGLALFQPEPEPA